MSLLQKIDSDLKDALKSKERAKVGVLRLIKAELKNKQIELKKDLSDQEIFAVLSRMVKQRKEAIDQYQKGGRKDLAQNEEIELTVIESYLPKPLSDQELNQMIAAAIKTTNAAGPRDMGAVMKELRDKTAGRVDGRVLADKVKSALAAVGS